MKWLSANSGRIAKRRITSCAKATASPCRSGSNSVCNSRSTVPKLSCRIWWLAPMNVRAAHIRWYRSSGIGSPVSKWRANRSSASFSQHQFSMICDGNSTQSRATLVPARARTSTRDRQWCSRWPNS